MFMGYRHDFVGSNLSTPGMLTIRTYIRTLKYVYENGYPWGERMIIVAVAQNGYLEYLKYTHENGRLQDENTTRNAAEVRVSGMLKVRTRDHVFVPTHIKEMKEIK
jgi:hypothetical protein